VLGGGDTGLQVANRLRACVGANPKAAFGDVVVLAVPFDAIKAARDKAGVLQAWVL
jgi:predicted dinucleotide-binding enzyme